MTTARTPPSILHVDLDAFYASVEQLHDPTLRGRPVVVGGLGPRGVVAAASYEARRYGIQSAMPMGRARRACPDAAFLAPRFDAYRDASETVMAILRAITPLVEPIALDEAFLDVSGVRRLRGTGAEIATELRRSIREETGLVASVGVATTKLVAKLASDTAKPDGLLVVEPGTELEFLHPLPVARLWGVGPKTARRLERLGVRTVAELAHLSEETLVHAVGEANGRHLHSLAWNRDERAVEPEHIAKSIGHEETFARDVTDRAALRRDIRRMAEQVATRLRSAAKVGRTVQIKVRYADFRTITRSRTLGEPTDVASAVAAVAAALLDGIELHDGVRLLGVSVQQLDDGAGAQERLPLEDADGHGDPYVRRRAVEESMDAIRDRFGSRAVSPATLVDRDTDRP